MTYDFLKNSSFNVSAKVSCLASRAPCRLFTLKNYRLVPGRWALDYSLEFTPGENVRMIGHPFSKGLELNSFYNPFTEKCSLWDLGSLMGQPNETVVKWMSQWGMLGFRLCGRCPRDLHYKVFRDPSVKEEIINDKDGQWFLSAEPLSYVKGLIVVARAACDLFHALKLKDSKSRAQRIRNLVEVGPPQDDPLSGGPDGLSREYFVHGVSIGWDENGPPHSSADWIDLGVRGVGQFTDTYLSGYTNLKWSPSRKGHVPPKLEWFVSELITVLFFKLASNWRRQKFCVACGVVMDNRRSHAQTCSSRCRKKVNRQCKLGVRENLD